MKIAVISDIHGNLEAFRNVLTDIQALGVDEIITLGDNIGYGPDPDQVTRMLIELGIPSVLGNHELAVRNRKHLNWFNPNARLALIKTIEMLSPDAMDFIAGLELFMVRHNCRFVHGFPPKSPTRYLFQISHDDMLKTFGDMQEWICFIGHTHELEFIEYDGRYLHRLPIRQDKFLLDPDHRYIFNVGSVGQPRDGDPRAKYVVLDTHFASLEIRYIPYEIAITVEKIIAAGLPKQYADRLY